MNKQERMIPNTRSGTRKEARIQTHTGGMAQEKNRIRKVRKSKGHAEIDTRTDRHPDTQTDRQTETDRHT